MMARHTDRKAKREVSWRNGEKIGDGNRELSNNRNNRKKKM